MILWLIACGFCFVAGQLHGQGKLIPWVRGAAGKARDAVFGLRPASAAMHQKAGLKPDAAPNMVQTEVSPTPPKNPIRAATNGEKPIAAVKNPLRFGEAVKNIFAFFVGLIGWAAKNPVAVVAIIVLALWLIYGAACSPFGLGKSRGELRLERDLAEGETQTQETINERDTDIAAIGQDIALLRQQIENLSQRGRDDLRAAAPANEAPIDPNLVSAWRANLDRMCVARADGSRADSCAL